MDVRRPLALGLAALTLAACSAGSSTSASPGADGSSAGAASSGAPTGTITVFAAASLTGSFTTLGRQFEAAHPGTTVRFNFGGSSTLAEQITQAAPADVFAAASQTTMDTVTGAGLASSPTTFATNSLEVATPTSPHVPVTSLADLAKPGLKVVVCQPAVPCGAAALKLFAANKLAVTPVSEEADVKAVLSKVALGEADAGIVYVTDVKAAGGSVVGVSIPAAQNVTTSYPIATIGSSPNAALARAFVDYVLSPDGQSVLNAAGFGSP